MMKAKLQAIIEKPKKKDGSPHLVTIKKDTICSGHYEQLMLITTPV